MELDKSTIEAIIRDVLREEMGKESGGLKRQIDPSGIIGIDPAGVRLDKFPFPIESDKVWLRDLLSLEESPRLGCGVMEMDHTEFEWTLSYDEVNTVIEGTLDILVEGRRVRATAGQVIFIPKNTKIKFSTPDKARWMYVCYPANWADQ